MATTADELLRAHGEAPPPEPTVPAALVRRLRAAQKRRLYVPSYASPAHAVEARLAEEEVDRLLEALEGGEK